MPKANELKKGAAIEHDGKVLILKDITVNNPTARGAATLYKMRFIDARTRQKVEHSFKGDQLLTGAELERRGCSYSYAEGDNSVFMDNEDFSQYSFANADVQEELQFINTQTDGLLVLLVDGEAIGLELPQSVELTVVDTAPAIKGASATARTKPATLDSGLVIQVPEYIETGEAIKVHTADKRFMARAES